MIKGGGVGVMPTDTIFGIVASALNPSSVARVYTEKARASSKPFVILVANYDQLPTIGINVKSSTLELLTRIWPASVSILLPCPDSRFEYLHRGTGELAVRMPDNTSLSEFVDKTGPIVATSANVSGHPTPTNITDIKKQLPSLDFYVDGHTGTTPSRLARLGDDGTLEWLQRN